MFPGGVGWSAWQAVARPAVVERRRAVASLMSGLTVAQNWSNNGNNYGGGPHLYCTSAAAVLLSVSIFLTM